MFQGFADYQAHSGQDTGSSFHQIAAASTDPMFWAEAAVATQPLDTTYRELLSKPLTGIDGGAEPPLRGKWTTYAVLSGKLDSDGLLNETSRKQLTILRSLAAQFHGNGLKTVIALRRISENTPEEGSLANAISDLNFDTATFVAAPDKDGNISEEPLLLFLSPEGHVIKAWRGAAGAADLGIVARQRLGIPAYSQIGERE